MGRSRTDDVPRTSCKRVLCHPVSLFVVPGGSCVQARGQQCTHRTPLPTQGHGPSLTDTYAHITHTQHRRVYNTHVTHGNVGTVFHCARRRCRWDSGGRVGPSSPAGQRAPEVVLGPSSPAGQKAPGKRQDTEPKEQTRCPWEGLRDPTEAPRITVRPGTLGTRVTDRGGLTSGSRPQGGLGRDVGDPLVGRAFWCRTFPGGFLVRRFGYSV